MANLKIKVGYVETAVRMKGSHNLILTVTGLEEEEELLRIVVTNLGKTFEPEALLNKFCLFRTDLPPVTIKKVESQAMIVCAEDPDGGIHFDTTNFPEGSIIKL